MILLAGLYKDVWGFGTMLGWTAGAAMILSALLAKLAAEVRLTSCGDVLSSKQA